MDEVIVNPPPVKRSAGRPRGSVRKNVEQRLNEALNVAAGLQKKLVRLNPAIDIDEPLTPEIFAPISSSQCIITKPATEVSKYAQEITNDYEYSRATYYNLIEKGSTAIDGILEIAAEGEEPRAYEVAATLISTVKDVTKELITLQKMMKDLKEQNETSTPTVNGDVTQNNLIVTTSELLKLIKEHE